MDSITPRDQAEAPGHEASDSVIHTMDKSSTQEIPDCVDIPNGTTQTQEVEVAAQISALKGQLEVLQARLKDTNQATSAANDTTQSVETGVTLPTPQEKTGEVHITDDSAKSEATDTAAIEIDDSPKPVVPKLNRVRWTEFKNTSLDDKHIYAIDILMGPAKFYWEKHKEQRNVTRHSRDQPESLEDAPSSFPEPVSATEQQEKLQNTAQEHIHTQNEMPERIRINCERLLMILREITDSAISSDPVVLLRPYKLLIHHEDGIRQWLRDLEAKWPTCLDEAQQYHYQPCLTRKASDTGEDFSEPSDSEVKTAASTTTQEMMQSYPALRSLRSLVQFMDTDVMPVHQRYKTSANDRIHFRDLWHLYRPGDVVVSYKDLDSTNNTVSGASIQGPSSFPSGTRRAVMWRILQVSKGRPVLGAPHSSDYEIERPRAPTHRVNKFSILCYMIAYNGKSYGPIDHTFEISPFEGQREIATLDPCPARWVANLDTLMKRLIDRGKRFAQYTRPTHCLYAGLTLLNHPSGIPCKSAHKPVLVDGHVIVDFNEAQRENSNWVLKLGMPEASGGSGLESTEDYPRYIWKDQSRSLLHKNESDRIHDDVHIDIADMDKFVASSRFLYAAKESSSDNEVDERTLEELDFALLPDRVVGFDLHRRRFSILALDHLHPVQEKREGWADLKLPRGHKHMVQAQVKTHFMEKRLRQLGAQRNIDHDIVRGKGQGLIILLHGAPGVGKTSTAECVAESLQKPLYPITCGDLGVTAGVVEETLSSTFTKAETWDCVLLLDEADVFLAQRTRTDLKRNAIVSVFLRVLEYYRGVLILTTNRVGSFDEAFKSRIHLHLYYPALNKDQTLAIWKMNLERVIERKQGNIVADEDDIMHFAEAHFERNKAGNMRWNGRQIRNAYQTALAMAEYEAIEGSDEAEWERRAMEGSVKAHLKVSHFRTVADASSQFDSYIEETIGTSDAGRAFTDRDRADHFKWMAPSVNAHSQHHNGQWPYGNQGGGDTYAHSKPDPFSQSSHPQQPGFPGMHSLEPTHAPHFQGQNWPGGTQPWTVNSQGMGRPPGESNTANPHASRGPEMYFPNKDAGHDERAFSQSRYGPQSDARPLATSPLYAQSLGAQAPSSTLDASHAHQQTNTAFRARPSAAVPGDDGY